MKNPAYMYQIDEERKGILYLKDQIGLNGRYIVKLLTNDFKPIMSKVDKSKHASKLLTKKELDNLKFIGFAD